MSVDPDPGSTTAAARTGPEHGGLVLTALILVAAVANLNLSVANVALPAIGRSSTPRRPPLNLVAVGYSLGLAASVLYLGAVGDRHGRKLMAIGGVALSIPAAILAAVAPSIEVLGAARILGGLSAGMAFPTTLALITALWAGPARTRSIALWSGIGGAIACPRPARRGRAARALLLGIGFPHHPAARRRSRSFWRSGRSQPTSTRRLSRSTTWAASSRSSWWAR